MSDNNEPSQYAVLFGGQDFIAEVVDHLHQQIVPTRVKMRIIPVAEFPKAISYLFVDDDPGLIEMVCDQVSGWAATLTPKSYLGIIAAIKSINSDFFVYAADRIQARLNMVVNLPSGSLEKMVKAQPRESGISSQNSRLQPA